MAEFQSWKQIEEQKEIMDAIKKIKELQRQQQHPDRNGMISALIDAKQTAPLDIIALEQMQTVNCWMPFDAFSNETLYWKLGQYQQGLENYCIEKVGKQMFDEFMKK